MAECVSVVRTYCACVAEECGLALAPAIMVPLEDALLATLQHEVLPPRHPRHRSAAEHAT